MRLSFLVAFVVTVVFFFGYAYYTARAICPIPIEYHIGKIDPQFNLSEDAARVAVAEAESVWEDATGENLFTYNPNSDFTVNFVYDERQAFTQAEENYREKLDEKKEVNDSISTQYADLIATYNDLQLSYSDKAKTYQSELANYNSDVAKYNDNGGAPPVAYKKLEDRKIKLDEERLELDRLAKKLQSLVEQINNIGDKGNKIVESYNQTVETYNDTFGKSREFTQGTYQTDGLINIYSYSNDAELRLVLAHEFGHALSLDHVMNEKSIMYYLIGQQPEPLVLSEEDKAQFIAICGQRDVWDKIKLGVNNLLKQI